MKGAPNAHVVTYLSLGLRFTQFLPLHKMKAFTESFFGDLHGCSNNHRPGRTEFHVRDLITLLLLVSQGDVRDSLNLSPKLELALIRDARLTFVRSMAVIPSPISSLLSLFKTT